MSGFFKPAENTSITSSDTSVPRQADRLLPGEAGTDSTFGRSVTVEDAHPFSRVAFRPPVEG